MRTAGALLRTSPPRSWRWPMQPDDYEVGYKHPPKHSQFKPGQSGNTKGRPRKRENLTSVIGEALLEKMTITENGRRKKVSKAAAMVKSLVNEGVKGDLKAVQLVVRVLDMLERHKKRGPAREKSQTPQLSGPVWPN